MGKIGVLYEKLDTTSDLCDGDNMADDTLCARSSVFLLGVFDDPVPLRRLRLVALSAFSDIGWMIVLRYAALLFQLQLYSVIFTRSI